MVGMSANHFKRGGGRLVKVLIVAAGSVVTKGRTRRILLFAGVTARVIKKDVY